MTVRKKTSKRAQARRRRAMFVLGLAGLILVGGGWWMSSRLLHAPTRVAHANGDEVGHDAEMIQQTFAVQQAVEAYARAHGGQVPDSADSFDRDVIQGGFLTGNRLPDSPWGGHQSRMIAANPSTLGNLGPATVESEIHSPNALGALLYQPVNATTYRLYGVGAGKNGQAAVIIQLGAPPDR